MEGAVTYFPYPHLHRERACRPTTRPLRLCSPACRDKYLASPMTAGLVGLRRVRRHPHHRPRSAPRAASPAVPALLGPGPHHIRGNDSSITGQRHRRKGQHVAPVAPAIRLHWTARRSDWPPRCGYCRQAGARRRRGRSEASWPAAGREWQHGKMPALALSHQPPRSARHARSRSNRDQRCLPDYPVQPRPGICRQRPILQGQGSRRVQPGQPAGGGLG